MFQATGGSLVLRLDDSLMNIVAPSLDGATRKSSLDGRRAGPYLTPTSSSHGCQEDEGLVGTWLSQASLEMARAFSDTSDTRWYYDERLQELGIGTESHSITSMVASISVQSTSLGRKNGGDRGWEETHVVCSPFLCLSIIFYSQFTDAPTQHRDC